MISPWHLAIWRSLQAKSQALPSSMLVVGKPGTGLLSLGMELAGMLLCDVISDGGYCATCGSCHLYAQGTHPDLHVISTEEVEQTGDLRFRSYSMRYTNLASTLKGRTTALKSVITVDQIRAVTDSLDKSPGIGLSKICLIYPADALNLNAANALLKSLEEPTGEAYFLLLSSFPDNLPPTIRSRCARIDLNNPTRVESLNWLTSEHNVDAKIADRLIEHGFGPHEVLEMIAEERMDAHQTVLDGLVGLISGKISACAFARQSIDCGIRLTLKIIQSEIYRGLRNSVQPDYNTKQPVLISSNLAIEFREVLFSVYFSIGGFLNWPTKAVDEQLFLESIAQELTFGSSNGLNR